MRWILTGAVVLVVGVSALVFHAISSTASHPTASTSSVNLLAQQALKEGTDLGGATAPDFSLRDQNGETVSLASLRGHPVVLTFLDSVCPHADCSLMAQYLNWTAKDMGVRSADVSWVAISVDPWHDTPASAAAFLQSRQVTMPFHFLLGTVSQLTPVWSTYHMQAILQSDGVVIHTSGLYVLDAQGRERLYLDEGFTPQALSGYLQVMLSQPGTLPSGTPAPTQATGTIVQTQSVSGNTISLTARPAQYGSYDFIVEVLDANGTPVQNAAVSINLTMLAMPMAPLDVALGPTKPSVPGAYEAQGVLSMVGQWQAIVKVRPVGGGSPIQATFVFTSQH
ncbi:MAG TPA: SCO family protein [Ktedonobacterales bacterium]|nr:SCO family protein [Ktedonobacterales bacterium]